MTDKNELKIDSDRGLRDDIGKPYEPDAQKSYLPDFQYTPPTPSVIPPTTEANSSTTSE